MPAYRYILFICITLCISSCKYQNLFTTDDTHPLEDLMRVDTNYQHVIGPDDKLSVSVWNHENMSIGSLFGIHNSNEVYGRWIMVNADSLAMLPKIGAVKLGGLTTIQAGDTLSKIYSDILVDPIIVVRVQNREVNVLGEVRTPGKYVLEKEVNTLTDMLGYAQGLMLYADKENIMLLRNNKYYRINLTVLENNNYRIIVQDDDVIYVPTRKGKMVDKRSPTLIAFASAITAMAVLISLVQ